jgi:hypothetical protein
MMQDSLPKGKEYQYLMMEFMEGRQGMANRGITKTSKNIKNTANVLFVS